MKLEWFCFKKFDLNSYEHFEQLENGDLNWIIPDKLIGFSSPYDKGLDQFGVYFVLISEQNAQSQRLSAHFQETRRENCHPF
jgi:hypothetical protein